METPSPLQPRNTQLAPCDAPLTGKISAPHVPLSFPLLLALDIAFQQQKSPRNPTSPQSVHHETNPHNASPTTSPGAPRRASNNPIRKDAPQPSPRSPLSARMQAPLGQVPSGQRRSSTQHAAAPSMMLLLPIPAIPGVAAPLIPSGGRGPPNPLLRIPRERTPQQQIKQEFLSQLLYHKDGSLRGGTLQKVLVHIAFVVVDAELTDCFLHGYRRYCGPNVLLKELRTAYQNRLDMSLMLPESIHDAYFCFLWEWIDLYYEQDFAKLVARAQLLDSLDPLPKELCNRLVLFILRCVGPPALNSMLQPRLRPASPHSNVHAKAPSAPVAATLSLPAGITMTQALAIRESNTVRKRSASVGHATKRFSVSLFSYFGVNTGDNDDDKLPASNVLPLPLSPAPLSLQHESPIASRSTSLLLTYRLEDLARQLTMIEFEMYDKVQASEFQDNAWQAAEKHVRAPFLTAMVSFSNKVTAWLTQEILRHPTGGSRQVEALERAVRLTEKCRELHNYNALMECHLATSQTSIERLKTTWSKVDEKVRVMHANHGELLTPVGNFRRFRDEIRTASEQSELPVLPYIGTFLRDVLFANDGNPNTLVESKQLLNWNKFQIVGNQINYWNKFKRYRFQFPLDLSLQQQLLSLPAAYDGEK